MIERHRRAPTVVDLARPNTQRPSSVLQSLSAPARRTQWLSWQLTPVISQISVELQNVGLTRPGRTRRHIGRPQGSPLRAYDDI